jgi:PPOX class probable F420-dependent enzyme
MSLPLTATAIKMLSDPNFAILSTSMPDGAPHATAMWVDVEGDRVVMATTPDTQKYRNISQDPRVCVTVLAQDDPYLELIIHGRVAEIRPDGKETLDRLSVQYYGVTPYPLYQKGQEWVTLLIAVDDVYTSEDAERY